MHLSNMLAFGQFEVLVFAIFLTITFVLKRWPTLVKD